MSGLDPIAQCARRIAVIIKLGTIASVAATLSGAFVTCRILPIS
jgi:hypothetical protein